MNKQILSIAASALLVAGCSGAQDEAPTAATVTQTVTAEPTTPAVEETTEAEPTTEEPTTEEPTAEEPATEEPTTEEPTTEEPTTEEPTTEEPVSTEAFGDSETSVRGNLIKEVGQLAGVVNEETNEPSVHFTLTDIEKNFQCADPEWSDPAANGQYIAFTFEVETFPSLADEEGPFYGTFGINEFYLTAFSKDGNRANDISGNALWCLDSAEALPGDMGPGQKATGKVVIDTDLESGFLVYEPGIDMNGNGWEWEF